MKIIKANNYEEVSKKAALIIVNQVMLDPSSALGLATGSTPIGLYKELVAAHKNMDLDFSKITTFNLDEYYPIKKSNKQSYNYFMNENLFKHININEDNINILNGETKDPEQECVNYEEKIRKNGLDIQILGIGSNGHIAFNEPKSKYDSVTRIVELNEATIQDNSRFFDKNEEVPKKALSMGISSIMTAKKIILLATGKNKAEAIKKMVEGPVTENCPASFLQKHDDVVVIVDKEAAHFLDKDAVPDFVKGYKIVTEENIPRNKSIAVISPHPDDSAIGLGATISMLSEKNRVHTLVMTTGHRSFIPNTTKEERINLREDEAIQEAKILNTELHLLRLGFYENENNIEKDLKILKNKLKEINPDILFINQIKDVQPTHVQSRQLVFEALKQLNVKPEIWNYESPWGLFSKGIFNTIVSVPANDFDNKIKSIKAHKSQIQRTDFVAVAEALATLRGALIPEQELYGFGSEPKGIKPKLEIFKIEDMK